jgi:hypothetical protein
MMKNTESWDANAQIVTEQELLKVPKTPNNSFNLIHTQKNKGANNGIYE